MKLTSEQEAVVAISGGSHLVLAPPGSGKTEMLSQRILRALASGVDPKRMLCATFTNRAAFEMRDRLAAASAILSPADSPPPLPDVGNLHHFCHRFLLSVHRLHPGKHVLDEVEQLEFMKELVDVLREELHGGASPVGLKRGVFVSVCIDGIDNPLRRKRLSDSLEDHFFGCSKRGVSPYPELLSAALVSQQTRIGIPFRCRRPMPPSMYAFAEEGVSRALAIAYSGLKRRFRCVDFDDLVNETYLWLEQNPLPEDRRFLWVQIDEVQDLNALQWSIVKHLTAASAVSVYFGDAEQAIFSFLGASSVCFADAVAHCERHYFKTNFRATPLLLEVLMRYSIAALDSDWEFLPSPAAAYDGASAVPRVLSRLTLSPTPPEGSVAAHVDGILASGIADNVAILVATNAEADAYEAEVKSLGYRLAKVSGCDLFAYAPMRDFLAFVSLFGSSTKRNDWSVLFRRFADGVSSRAEARYFVRDLFAAGFDPISLFDSAAFHDVFSLPSLRKTFFTLRHFRRLDSLRRNLKPSYDRISCLLLASEPPLSFRDLFFAFAAVAFDGSPRYTLFELLPGVKITEEMLSDPKEYDAAVAYARERIERFLRYTDHLYSADKRSLRSILHEDFETLARLKEADLLLGDEKIVISTIHKAKGRQFDAVVIPAVSSVLSASSPEERAEARRLLYVAMSRARRHLSLFAADRSSAAVACMSQCFEPGYVDYYAATAVAPIENDWLYHWERLSRMNAARRCDLPVLSDSLRLASVPVARMALKCCRHLDDPNRRRRLLLEAVTGGVSPVCAATAVDCLRDCSVFDGETLSIIRSAALSAASRELPRSAFRYLLAVASSRSALPAVPSSSPSADRATVTAAIGDFLYSRFADLRFAAASSLFDLGDDRWRMHIVGSSRDFDYLASVADPEHENTIRILLQHSHSATYETRLRNILRARALRIR